MTVIMKYLRYRGVIVSMKIAICEDCKCQHQNVEKFQHENA